MQTDGYNGYDGHWQMMDGGAGSGWLMVVLMLVVLLAVVLGLAYLARLVVREHPAQGTDRPPLRDEEYALGLLRERLARGDIDEPEYESRVRTLQQH